MKYKYFRYLFFLLFCFFALACSAKGPEAYMSAAQSLESRATSSPVMPKKLIKEAYLVFESNNLESTKNAVLGAVKKYKGYVSSDQESMNEGKTSNTLVIRVPADNFDGLLQEATQGVENFDQRQSNIRDVTEEFFDVEARLKVKKELEQRYLELLKKAESVAEILEIEKQSASLRGEIESIEGRLKYLQNQISLSTLTITFYSFSPSARAPFWRDFNSSLKNGYDNLVYSLIFLGNIWPFILIALVLVLVLFRKKKRRSRKATQKV